jgi:hypothetical protein
VPWRPLDDEDFPTLGHKVIAWGEKVLVHPDGQKRGQPWTWTDEQKWHILRAYQIDPLTGQRVYRRSCFIRPKKYGKGPFSAALTWCEATGPCRFGGWTDRGRPIVLPIQEAPREFGGGWTPLVEVLGTSEDQCGNIWRPLLAMAANVATTTGIGVDAGLTRVLLDGGASGLMKPVTSGATSREGEQVTFATCDETWAWVPSNGGRRLADVIRRNVGGTNGWVLETSNAPAIGSSSVAESTVESVETLGSKDILLDWRQPSGPAPERDDVEAVRREIIYVYGKHATTSGGWVNPDRQLAEALDPGTQWSDALRFYMNRRSTAGGAWLSKDLWATCARPGRIVAAGEQIAVGFDGSKGETEHADHTVLLGCCLSDGHLFVIRHFIPVQLGDGSWAINQRDVDAAVAQTFATYDVWRMYADPPYYGPWLAAWDARYPDRVVSFDTTKAWRMAPAIEAVETSTREGLLSHSGDPALAEHVGNAVTVNRGSADQPKVVISKEFPQSLRKIDLAVGAVIAYQARNDAVADGALAPTPAGAYYRF